MLSFPSGNQPSVLTSGHSFSQVPKPTFSDPLLTDRTAIKPHSTVATSFPFSWMRLYRGIALTSKCRRSHVFPLLLSRSWTICICRPSSSRFRTALSGRTSKNSVANKPQPPLQQTSQCRSSQPILRLLNLSLTIWVFRSPERQLLSAQAVPLSTCPYGIVLII